MQATPSNLAHALAPAAVDYQVLRARHDTFIQLGRRLLGIEANCYPFMEIWPTSFRTYNLLVPNFFNIPLPLLGIDPGVGLIGTAIYASSRAAECMYCSAHSCTIAARGGADRKMLESIAEPGDAHTEGEAALVRMAQRMSTIPPTLEAADVAALQRAYSTSTADWLAHAVAMMGYLNKMMDGMGFDIEASLVAEVHDVMSASGWTSGRHHVAENSRPVFAPAGGPKRTLLAMLPYMPGAILQDKRWTRGVPGAPDKAMALLEDLTGYDFPIVGRIAQTRIVRTLTTMLRDNLTAEDSALGLPLKHTAGFVYAIGLGNEELARGSRAMAEAAGVDAASLDALAELAEVPLDLADPEAIDGATKTYDARTAAALMLAKGLCATPALVTPEVVKRTAADLEPAPTIELVTWFSLLSLLHRVDVFQRARADAV